jgi:hypothetical protein
MRALLDFLAGCTRARVNLLDGNFWKTVVVLLGSAILGSGAMGQDKVTSKAVEKEGLSLTISLDKAAYRLGEEIKLSFELKNVSNRDMFIGDGFLAPDYHEAGPARHFEILITADDRKELRFWSGASTEGGTAGVRKVFPIAPGGTYGGRIRIGREIDPKLAHEERGGSLEEKETGKRHVLGIDGKKYTLILRYQVNPRTHGVVKPPSGFADALLWTGSLDSQPLALEVSPK